MKRISLLSLLFCLLSVGQTWADDIIPNVLTSSATISNDATSTWDGSSLKLTSNSSSSKVLFWTTWTTGSVTLTLTNNYTSDITVSFKYTYAKANSTSSFTINSSPISKTTTKTEYHCDISAGSSITISLATGKEANEETAVLSDFSYTTNETFTEFGVTIKSEDTPSCTFAVSTNNDDAQIESNNSSTVSVSKLTTATTVSATATVPSGYKVFGWYTKDADNKETYISYSTDLSYPFTSDATVYIKCVSNDTPIFMLKTKGLRYSDLNDADAASTANSHDIIVLISNGKLQSGSYKISSGNTLLIPSDDAYTCSNTSDGPEYINGNTTPSVYKTLSMANGASINVSGKICVNGQMSCNMGYNGAITGKYGYITMEQGSSMALNSGASLFCWGFISGDGTINALEGSKVYEDFQIKDFRGGTATSGMNKNADKVFPFHQYFIQNIEVPLTINYGAEDHVRAWVYAGSQYASTGDVIYIGTNSETALFKLSSGSLMKKYDPINDRQIYNLNGNASLGSLELDINVLFLSLNVSSADYVLPFTPNFTITLNEGSTFTTDYDLAIIPGVEITIEKGANFNIGSSSSTPSMYVYDMDDWYVGYSKSSTDKESGYLYGTYSTSSTLGVVYSPTKTKQRKVSDLTDAMIDVQGTITVNGSLYTTTNGANICCSEGNGVVTWAKAASANTTTHQAIQYVTETATDGTSVKYADISVTSAQLENCDASYTATTGTTAGTSYYYVNGYWLPNLNIDTYIAGATNPGTTTLNSWATVQSANPNAIAVITKANNETNDYASHLTNMLVNDNGTYTCPNFVITDKQPIYIPNVFTAEKASYTRAMDGINWGTICLPFAPTTSDCKYYYLSGDGVKNNSLELTETTSPSANTPYVFKKTENAEGISVSATDATVYKTGDLTTATCNGWTLTGAYERKSVFENESAYTEYQNASNLGTKVLADDGTNTYYAYYIKSDKFLLDNKYFNNSPFRAYILSETNLNSSNGAKLQTILFDDSQIATSINALESEDVTIIGYYSINGIKYNELQPGLNIIKYSNGKTSKVFVK